MTRAPHRGRKGLHRYEHLREEHTPQDSGRRSLTLPVTRADRAPTVSEKRTWVSPVLGNRCVKPKTKLGLPVRKSFLLECPFETAAVE